ncbi:amidohydrolase family protein [Sphingomonas sp. 1P06PA]|uniref:metal-dependent hydrolase family protein n=1 Tax=Sphingomonas sp. 1P06PA TaxID=554121 RepID=UPI0039A4CA1D
MRLILAAAAAALLAGTALAQAPAAPAPAPQPKLTYIHAGALLDRPGQRPRGQSTIIVRGDRIEAIRDGFVPPEAGATLVDLKDRFVLPGLIDMHVHLWGIGGDPLRSRLTALGNDDADNMVVAIENARTTLDAGFTTVRDLGGNPRGIRAMRDGMARGALTGPTIVNAGRMISITGGHGDGTNGVSEVFADAIHEHQINTCDGADDCRRAVRAQIGLGAQVIKFAATGGVLSNVAGGLGRAMTQEEMKAICDTAHEFGRKVAAHSHAAEGTKAAILAGVDTIDHGTFLDDEAIRLFKQKGVWLVPTMIAPQTALAFARGGQLPANTIPKAEEAATAAIASHRRAIASGVKIAFGTDTGVSKHGENAKEFALMVGAGMTPMQAITAATVSASQAIGREAQIGTIEPGKTADIIAVTGDPLADVRRLETVDFVMARGAVAKQDGRRTLAE